MEQRPEPPRSWPWLDDEDTGSEPRRSRRGPLLAAAAVPWLVVAVLVVRGGPVAGGTTAEPVTGAPSPTTPMDATPEPSVPPGTDPSSGPASATGDDGGAPSGTVAVAVSSAARHSVDVGDAVTVAMLVARSWFRGPGPVLEPVHPSLAAASSGYLEHLWVEAVDAPWRGHVVVTLGAVVLERSPEGELRAVARRLAVPVALDADGARAVAAPYRLPDPAIEYEPPALEPVDDPDRLVAAAEALSDAGYVDAEVTELARSDGWPWVATVATADGGRRDVWLRPHLGGFVVAGWLPSRASPPPSTGAPDDAGQEVAP